MKKAAPFVTRVSLSPNTVFFQKEELENLGPDEGLRGYKERRIPKAKIKWFEYLKIKH